MEFGIDSALSTPSPARVHDLATPCADTGRRRTRPAILVVDDEPTVIRVIEMFLDGEGYDLVTATNADDALTLLRENVGRIELLLVDRVLPDCDGLALLRRMIGIAGTLPAILMSGALAPDELQDLAALTPVSFLSKPFRADGLFRAIETSLAETPRVGHS
jgi:DNA-binding NtrC family response regulator